MTASTLVRRARFIVAGGVAGLAAACSTLPPPAFYTLDVAGPVVSSACGAGQPVLVVASVTLPEYADRDQLVHRVASHELSLQDDSHWAERPSVSMTRVVAAALAKSGAYCVQAGTDTGATLELHLALSQFEFDADGAAHLGGLWKLVKAPDDGIVQAGAIDQRQAASTPSTAGSIAAMNEAVAAAADGIAQAIQAGVARAR